MQETHAETTPSTRTSSSSLWHAASILGLVLILILQPSYGDSLYQSSIDYIISKQEGLTEGGVKAWEFFSDYGLAIVILTPVLFFLYQPREKPRAFYYLGLLTGFLFIMNVGKLAYHEPRPSWVSPEVQAFYCSGQYGDPSGHTMSATMTVLTVWLDYNASIGDSQRWASSVLAKWYSKLAFLAIGLTFAVTIGYSRLVLGAHTWNQVLFGIQLGIWFPLTLHFCYREKLLNNISRLLDASEPSYSNQVYKWLLVMLGAIAIETVNYAVLAPRIVNDPLWSTQIAIKCPKEDLSLAFQSQSMLQNGYIGLGFGAYLGVVFFAWRNPASTVTPDVMMATWEKVVRVLLGLALCLPFLALTLLKQEQIPNIYVLSLVSAFIPTFMSGFMVFGVLDEVCQKLGIIKNADQASMMVFVVDDDNAYKSEENKALKESLLQNHERNRSALIN